MGAGDASYDPPAVDGGFGPARGSEAGGDGGGGQEPYTRGSVGQSYVVSSSEVRAGCLV